MPDYHEPSPREIVLGWALIIFLLLACLGICYYYGCFDYLKPWRK